MTITFGNEMEAERLKRRRAIAEAQLAASMTPGPVQGQFSDPFSPLARVAQAYFGGKEQSAVDTEQKELMEDSRQQSQRALDEYTRAVTPREAVAASMVEDPAGVHEMPAQPGYTPTPEQKRVAALKLSGQVGVNPADTAKLLVAEAMKPEKKDSPFAKVDPKDYTDESLAAFNSSGDHTVLRRRETPKEPPAPPSEIREYEYAVKQGYKGDFVQWKKDNKPAGTTVNVDASGKKYGEAFASEVARSDVSLLEAARKAPALAERANQIKETLASGRVITGAGADYRLALGKALNLVGASDEETIANTETLATSLAQNTLDAIKASGLGSGTGFSNADRDFLEKAVGGKISLEAKTIDRLAELAHRAATLTAERWSKRVQDIPSGALEGTGIRRDPITVPAIFKRTAKPAGPTLSPEAQRYLDAARGSK